MKIIVKNSDIANNVKFKLKAGAAGIVNVLRQIGATAQKEDGEWNFCLAPAFANISCDLAGSAVFFPFDLDYDVASKPTGGLEYFWDQSLNNGTGDTIDEAWSQVFNSRYVDDKIVNWHLFINDRYIGTTDIWPLSEQDESHPNYDPERYDITIQTLIEKVPGLVITNLDYTDIHAHGILADLWAESYPLDNIEITSPFRTINYLWGSVYNNTTPEEMRIRLVPTNKAVTFNQRWSAIFNMWPGMPQQNFAALADIPPIAETIRGNSSVTVDEVDGAISFCLAPYVEKLEISCDGANEQVSINVSLSWQGESGGAITVYNDETNEIISEIQGYYLDLPDYNMANETSPQIEYISTIAETSSSSTEYENYRTTQQLITYRNKSSAPIRLRIEILNYEQDRFPKTFIGEETEFHHNPTFALMEETSQRAVYGVCLAPTIPDACTPTTLTVVPTLTTQSLDNTQQYTITYSVNDGPDIVASGRPVYSYADDYVTDPCLAIAGYLRQANPQVNGVDFDLFFGFNFPTLEGYEIYDQMPENTASFTIKFKKTDPVNLVGTDLINLMFEQDEVILHSCWHSNDD